MWLDLPKGALLVHSLNVHFSLQIDGYNNRLTSSCVYHSQRYNSVLLLRLHSSAYLHSKVLGWPIKGPIFPGQAYSQQGTTTWQAGETGHGFSYILWYVELKTTWTDDIWQIWPYKNFELELPQLHGYWPPTTPGVFVVLITWWNKLSKMVGNSTT